MAIKRAINIDNLDFAYTLGQISLTELIKQLPEEPRRFYMFGVPDYNNLGDQAVAYAEKAFFKRVFPEITYIEILESQTDDAIKELVPMLRESDMIGYTGGGNIGNTYLDHEEPRRKVFSTFVNNKTISFPQSVNFEDTKQGQEELRKSQEAYNKNPNLTLVARETQSLDYFKKNFDVDVIFYMFGTPIYNNLGDLAVSEAQKRFFAENFPGIVYIEITEPQTDQAIEELLPLLRPDDMIGYVGGGNIGNLHIAHEIPRRKVFSTFVNNKTISFPQSVYFEDTEEGQEELRKSQEAYNKNPNLTLVARDTQTLNYFKEHFEVNAILTSDMVLFLQPKRPEFERDGTLFIMRKDAEKVTSDELIAQLTNSLENAGEEVEPTDTVLSFKAYDVKTDADPPLDIVRISERDWLLTLKLDQIKANKVVVTDRLHGMIFSVITQTPCLVFDNNYGKASAFYYNWLEDLDYIQHTTESDPKKLTEMVEDLKKYDHSYALDFSHSYNTLIDLIKN